jgi:hypothetical protein
MRYSFLQRCDHRDMLVGVPDALILSHDEGVLLGGFGD